MSIIKYSSEPAAKKRKISHSSGPKPQPDNIATNAIPSKSFVMDHLVKDLLTEVTPDYETQRSRIEPTLERIVTIIEGAPLRSPLSALEAEKLIRKVSGVAVPFPEPRPGKETQYQFEFQKPESVTVAGEASSENYLKGPRTADVLVTMPTSIFQKKDYLNSRALHKRAFYLACIVAAVGSEVKDEFLLQYDCLDDISCLPVLLITPNEKSPAGLIRSKTSIRVLVGFPADAIPLDKTLPNKNCVRPPGGASAEDALEPTPFYNSCLRAAASLLSNATLINSTAKKCLAFSEACRLGRIWLRQRGLDSSVSKGGFGPYEWMLLCALLFKSGGHKGRPILSLRFSALQIFKVMLRFIAESDLTDSLVIDADGLTLDKSDQPIVYDGSTGVNILFKMTPGSYAALRRIAAQSVNVINAAGSNSFESTFISRIEDTFLRFDECWLIDISTLHESVYDSAKTNSITMDISKILRRGFGDRVPRFDIQLPSTGPWEIGKAPKQASNSNHIFVQLLHNPEAASRLVDRGPSAEEPDETADFREFWGPKAELRRFKDGTICESLVWTEGSSVTLQIAQHLLKHRRGLPNDAISSTGSSAALETQMLPSPPHSLSTYDTFQLLHKTYQDLTNTLLQIKDMPLRIKSTTPLDSSLSSSSLEPLSHHPINMQIEFEDSPRWPDTLAAIEHTKTAFLIKLADALDESSPHLTTRVGVENQDRSSTAEVADSQHGYLFNRAFLDIIYPNPGSGVPKIAFRIRIYNPRTTLLLKNTVQSLSSSRNALRAHASQALAESTATTHLAAHTLAIRNLCSANPILSPTIRLLKKWTASHLLSPHIPFQLIELVAAAALPIPHTNEVPGSATTGFLRALNFLANWDWLTAPLALSLDPANPQLTRDIDDAIRTAFEMWRKNDPALHRVAVVAGSNLDPTGALWTRQQPLRGRSGTSPTALRGVSAVIMKRWCALAGHAIGVVAAWHAPFSPARISGGEKPTDPWPWRTALFRSPLADYDFLIHLAPRLVRGSATPRKKQQAAAARFKNLALAASGALDAGVSVEEMGFDAVQLLLDDLEAAFGSAALFFWDASGEGGVVAGLWRPDALGRKVVGGKVAMGFGFAWPVMPVRQGGREGDGDGEEEQVVINQASILAQIAQMGAGMVTKVEKVKEFVA